MSDVAPDFTYSKSIDRRAMLLEAAQLLDDLEGHLGTGKGEKLVNIVAQQLREQADDQASFADVPRMYRITDEYFLRHSPDKTVPYDFIQLKEQCDFYWLDIPINLRPKTKWVFNEIDVEIEFNPDAPKDGTRPKSYQIFPDEQFVEYMKLHAQAEVGLGANGCFNLQVPTISVPLGATLLPIVTDIAAGTDNKVDFNIGAEIPRHVLTLRADKITHAAPFAETVWWNLRGKEFSQEHRPLLSVIVQVLKGTKEFRIRAEMDVARSFRYAPSNIREAIEDLPIKFKELFEKGAPIHREPLEGVWDMTRFL